MSIPSTPSYFDLLYRFQCSFVSYLDPTFKSVRQSSDTRIGVQTRYDGDN